MQKLFHRIKKGRRSPFANRWCETVETLLGGCWIAALFVQADVKVGVAVTGVLLEWAS
jgi:hypothetical protein